MEAGIGDGKEPWAEESADGIEGKNRWKKRHLLNLVL
jgi:hypothetical protein